MGNLTIAWPTCTPARREHNWQPGIGYLRWPLASMLELGPHPAAPASARLHTKTVLTGWGLPRDMIADAEMCVSETITNALRATLSLSEPLPSNRWGTRRLSPHVKTVWCELLMPPARQGGPGR